jgi:hypothetical protein
MKAPVYNRTQLNDRGNDFPFCNKPTASVDCNVAETSQAIQLVTGQQLTALHIRQVAGDMEGGSGTTLATKAFLSVGMKAGEDFTRFRDVPVEQVRALLRDGWFVTGFIDYGVMIDVSAKKFVGSKTYRGAHAVSMAGWARVGGKRVVWDYDPLFDGRTRSGWTYPMGRQRVPFWMIRDAMAGYAGPGLASGYAVR